jgi:thymidine kinase
MSFDLESRLYEGFKVIFTGPMCASKSLQLIHVNGQLTSIGQEVYPFVHKLNFADNPEIVSRLKGSRNEHIAIKATEVACSGDLLSIVEESLVKTMDVGLQNFVWDQSLVSYLKSKNKMVEVNGKIRWNPQKYVLIDELNFFDEGIKEAIQKLSYWGVNVFAGGLEHDFRRELFVLDGGTTISEIAGVMDEHYKLTARCQYEVSKGVFCGEVARYTLRFRDLEHKEPAHYNDELIVNDKRLYIPVCREHHFVPGKFK